jgi:hypothetical protein
VSLLGGFSAMSIFDPSVQNINIPDGDITSNFDISNPSAMYINVPFNISNTGVYDLTNIALSFQVAMTYGDALTPLNETTTVIIFDKEEIIGTIAHGDSLKSNFIGTLSDGFIAANIPDPLTEVDWYRTPYALEFHASLQFSASYSLNLYTFKVNIINFPAGHYP